MSRRAIPCRIANVVVDAIDQQIKPHPHPITVLAGLGIVVCAYFDHLPQAMRLEIMESWFEEVRADVEENLGQGHPAPPAVQ